MAGVDESFVQIDGPWRHREITANGARFHAAELGTGPLVLLLHGFPQFWWTWRHQMPAIAAAGWRAVAPDLRGYGASDKPPRGYDALTAAADIVGMIRALGERDAVVIGHDWGGFLGWTAAVRAVTTVRALAVVSIPHPLTLRAALFTNPRGGQLAASKHLFGFQVPRRAERSLVAHDAERVGGFLHDWAGPGWPDAATERTYRTAMQIPHVAHSSLEYFRWALRSQTRADGQRFAGLLTTPVAAPVLQLHGALDTCILPSTAFGSSSHVEGPYDWRLLESVGHFPHEEAPDPVNHLLVDWLAATGRPLPSGLDNPPVRAEGGTDPADPAKPAEPSRRSPPQ